MEEKNNRNREIYQEYLNSCIARNEATKNTTYKIYSNNMKQFIDYVKRYENNRYLLSKDTLKVIVSILERYIRYCREVKKNNAQTVNNKLTAVSSFYIWSVKRGLISSHPFREKLDRLKVTDIEKKRNSYYLSYTDILTVSLKLEMINKFDWQDRLIWELLLDSGCRISALQSIKILQIDLENGLIKNVKEKENKLVDLIFFETTKNILEQLLEYRKEKNIFSEYLLVTKYRKTFKQMSKSTIRDRVRKIGELLGIKNLYPHTLRKTSINLLANIGNIDIASEFANHNGVDVTKKHYIKKLSGKEKREKILAIRKGFLK